MTMYPTPDYAMRCEVARQQGYASAYLGCPYNNNPYPVSNRYHNPWCEGYHEAERDQATTRTARKAPALGQTWCPLCGCELTHSGWCHTCNKTGA